MSKIIIFENFWTLNDIKNNPEYLWVYGDNDVKRGKGGQAIIRDEINTIGIPTKKYPSNNPKSFYTDDEYIINCEKITKAINNIKEKGKLYKAIVIPKNGFGTGLAKLEQLAPKTFTFLNTQIKNLIDSYN